MVAAQQAAYDRVSEKVLNSLLQNAVARSFIITCVSCFLGLYKGRSRRGNSQKGRKEKERKKEATSWADFRGQFQELCPPSQLLSTRVGQRPRAVGLPSLLLSSTIPVDGEV